MTTTNDYDLAVLATNDVLVVAEAIRRAQYLSNANDATASNGGVWGVLHTALVDTVAIYFATRQGESPEGARNAATAVVDEIYDNGENVAYNVELATSHLYG